MSPFPLCLFNTLKPLQLDPFYYFILRTFNFFFLNKRFLIFVRSTNTGCACFFSLNKRNFLVIYHIFQRLILILINWIKCLIVYRNLGNSSCCFRLCFIELFKIFIIKLYRFNTKILFELRLFRLKIFDASLLSN